MEFGHPGGGEKCDQSHIDAGLVASVIGDGSRERLERQTGRRRSIGWAGTTEIAGGPSLIAKTNPSWAKYSFKIIHVSQIFGLFLILQVSEKSSSIPNLEHSAK